MADIIKLQVPLSDEDTRSLNAGDEVEISGVVYTARDQAHKRLCASIDAGEKLPFELEGQVIYFVGPTPAASGQVIGAAGPTTSSRMDAFSPMLIANGLKGMIGKGLRSEEVIESMKKNKAVYFAAVGGAAALIAQTIKKSEVIAYPDLGAEAIHRYLVEDFPAIVCIDSYGNNLYESEPPKYISE